MCDTKQKRSFVKIVCKNLNCKNNWDIVDPHGKSSGLLLFWGDTFSICKIKNSEFCTEVEVEGRDFDGKLWIIFVYLSPEDIKR